MEENKNDKPEELKDNSKVESTSEVQANEETKKEEKTETKKEEKKEEAKKELDPEAKKKITKVIVIGVLLIAIIVAIIVYFAVFHKKTINLADYIDVSYYSGSYYDYYEDSDNPAYDGYATATISLNKKKLKELLDSNRAAERFIEKAELTIENDDNGNLSNGDTLNIKVKISSSYLDDQKLKLKSETVSIPVEGLDEADVLDLFDEADFEVEVSGVSPELYVTANNNSSNEFIRRNVTYSVSDSSGVANGDTVTITAYYDESTALEKGIVIAKDTYEYEVSGMPEYADSAEDLTDEALETLKAGFVESVKDQIDYQEEYVISYNYDDVDTSAGYTNTEPELVATYLLTKKGDTSGYWSYPENRICAIYKVIYTMTATGTNYEWYYVVSTSKVAIGDDGLYEADNLSYSTSDRWDDGKTQQEAYDEQIDSYKSNYVIETVE